MRLAPSQIRDDSFKSQNTDILLTVPQVRYTSNLSRSSKNIDVYLHICQRVFSDFRPEAHLCIKYLSISTRENIPSSWPQTGQFPTQETLGMKFIQCTVVKGCKLVIGTFFCSTEQCWIRHFSLQVAAIKCYKIIFHGLQRGGWFIEVFLISTDRLGRLKVENDSGIGILAGVQLMWKWNRGQIALLWLARSLPCI